MKWAKKGQFYLITSIILIALAFTIIQNVDAQPKPYSSFVDITQEIESDSAVVLNQAIYDQKNITLAYEEYVQEYLKYALTLDSTVRVVYILNQGSEMKIYNGLNAPININNGQYIVQQGMDTSTPVMDLSVLVKGSSYQFSFEKGAVQVGIIILSGNEANQQIKVIHVG